MLMFTLLKYKINIKMSEYKRTHECCFNKRKKETIYRAYVSVCPSLSCLSVYLYTLANRNPFLFELK